MTLIRKLITFCFFIFTFSVLSQNAIAQDLSYFMLGTNELRNTEIYSILQTKDQRLFIATNEGLYEYKYGTMTLIDASKNQRGSSLFNLISNSKDEVFCTNLNGQIFKVVNNQLILYTEVPSEYLNESIHMTFGDLDELYFVSKYAVLIKKNSVEVIYNSNEKPARGLTNLPDGRIFLRVNFSDSLVQLINGKAVSVNNPINKADLGIHVSVYTLNDSLVFSCELNEISNTTIDKRPFSKQYVYKQFSKDLIWRRLSTGGVETIQKEDGRLVIKGHYFHEHFISDISMGINGTLFFGTFGKGVIVVPNTKSKRHYLRGFAKNIQSITANDSGDVFISDRVNGILHYNKDVTRIDQTDYVPEKLFTVKNKSFGVIKKFPSLFYNTEGYEGALKNIFTIADSTLLLSTSLGILKVGKATILDDSLWRPLRPPSMSRFFISINERCLDAVYDQNHEILYVASISSLLKFTSSAIDTVLFEGNPINAYDLILQNDTLLVATQNYGILFLKSGKVVDQINKKDGLENNYIHKFYKRDNQLFISHRSGFQIYNLKTKKWKTLGITEGVEKKAVRDFAVGKSLLWLAGNDYLISFPIDTNNTPTAGFRFRIDSAIVQDKKILPTKSYTFQFDENHFTVYPNFKGVLYEPEAYYEYSLNSFDKGIHSIPVTQQRISYEFLPPGNYMFSINTVYRGIKSKPINYSFTINKALWQSPWFYLILALLTIGIISFVLVLRNRQNQKGNRKKLESQLLKTSVIESELKALRSQMNPHFIFNSLNSIQDLILQNDTEASYDSIVLFSELVRNALNYSNQEFITIEKEIEFLETYLTLEKLRFGDQFSYTINYAASKAIKIPSLTIQPFIENAIVHGLFHKEKGKKLTIDFSLINDTFQCVVTDNGIGREEARRIQERQGKEHTSFALDAMQRRFDILKIKYPENLGFQIIDIVKNNISAGTKVIIRLPYFN